MKQIDLVAENSSKFQQALEAARTALAASRGGLEAGGLEAGRNRDIDVASETLAGRRPREAPRSASEARTLSALEAIVLDRLRPAWLVKDNAIAISGEYDNEALVTTNRATLEAAVRQVGRVDLFNHRNLSYAGTGWLIDKSIAVTNRHVAQVFSTRTWDGRWDFADGVFGETMEARLDFVRQHQDDGVRRCRADVIEVLYVAGDREPDIAFLKVDAGAESEALELDATPLRAEVAAAAVGYPAWDGERNDPDLMEELFGGIYGVKRFSPGMVRPARGNATEILGDYTSLGGNSGSAVIALETGKVLGLHFAGSFRDTNWAVSADIVAAALREIRTAVSVKAPVETPQSVPSSFAGRKGYDPDFLGAGPLAVPLPPLGRWAGDIAPVSDDDAGILKYTHFSVLQSKSRRLPLLTAVNIDGERAFELKRKGSWQSDGRVEVHHQVGNALYVSNALDRGHLVRRKDPGWGDTRQDAELAERDTFHYTNCAPQHKDLNQRDWVGLEDYILSSAKTRGFKASVMTGPVFRDSDRRLKHQPGAEDIQIPVEYWKIAAMINDTTGTLSVSG